MLCCLCLAAQLRPTLCNHVDCSPPGSSVQGDSPVKNTGVGCHAFLQGVSRIAGRCFTTEPLGKPKNSGVSHQCLWILGWVAVPSSRGSSQSRHPTQASQTVGRLFTKGSPVLQRQCDAAQRVRLSARGCHSFCRRRPAQPLVGTAMGPLPSNQLSGGNLRGSIQLGVGGVVVLRQRGSEVSEGSWPSPRGSPVPRASGQQVSQGAGSRLGAGSRALAKASHRLDSGQ